MEILKESDYYILENGEIRAVDGAEYRAWRLGESPAMSKRRIAQDFVNGVEISTVFAGSNPIYVTGEGPVLFETLVFGGELDMHGEKSVTLEQARSTHDKYVAMVRALDGVLNPPDHK